MPVARTPASAPVSASRSAVPLPFPRIALVGRYATPGIAAPLAELAAFLTVGRHPIAGIAAAFAGVAGVFLVNVFIVPVDGILTEITNDAIHLLDPNTSIDLAANLYFGIVCSIILTFVCVFITERVVEPRLGPYHGERPEQAEGGVSFAEAKGLRWAFWGLVAVMALIAALTLPEGAPLRDPVTGAIGGNSPFMSSLIVIISAAFLITGIAFGRATGTIKGSADTLGMITKAWASLASLLFLFLLIAQFIAYFDFSNIARVVAISLGDLLEQAGLASIWLLIGIIFLTILVNILIPAKIAKWAIVAPIFVPLMLRLGVEPQTVLAAYRVGDSPTNVLTPLMPYFPLMVVFAARYQKGAGVGTVIALMLPYAAILTVVWTLFFVAWYLLGIPLGPGSPV